jgi:hypothetical protein
VLSKTASKIDTKTQTTNASGTSQFGIYVRIVSSSAIAADARSAEYAGHMRRAIARRSRRAAAQAGLEFVATDCPTRLIRCALGRRQIAQDSAIVRGVASVSDVAKCHIRAPA